MTERPEVPAHQNSPNSPDYRLREVCRNIFINFNILINKVIKIYLADWNICFYFVLIN